MAYIDTPATERGDLTNLSAHNIDFSFAQPFGSPSRNPAENLRNQMRGLRNGAKPKGQTMQTPRVRNNLLDKRNPPGPQKQEFTPLLKSAKRKSVMYTSIPEEKENLGIPSTPREFRSSFISNTPALPVNSSMLDGDHTASSMLDEATPAAPAVSSSMYDSTPIPRMTKDGEGVVLEQGNMLTLRDQEAKLDQIQKDNFGLKLKIHYLEEALRKTGSEFHQATMKENVELKTAKFTLEQDMKKQRKRLLEALHQLEEYKSKYEECSLLMKKRSATEQDSEELERLKRLADEAQRMADEREAELEELRTRLEDAEKPQDNAELQRLRDDIQDLEAETRDRERQLDEKDEQIESLQDQLKNHKGDVEDVGQLQEDINELEGELKAKETELASKDTQIQQLEERIEENADNAATIDQLHEDMDELKDQLQSKNAELDDSLERFRSLEESHRAEIARLLSQLQSRDENLGRSREEKEMFERELQNIREVNAAELRQKDDTLRNTQRELADKEGEVEALQERLQTARGSWDAEMRETDSRIQERDQQIQEREARLREQSRIIGQRDEELTALRTRLQRAETTQGEIKADDAKLLREKSEQIVELREELQNGRLSFQARLNEKDGLIQAHEEKIKSIQGQLTAFKSGGITKERERDEQIVGLERSLKQRDGTIQDQSQQILSLKSRLGAMETPSRKDSLIKQQAEQVRLLQEQLQKLEQDRDQELDELEQQLRDCELENSDLQHEIELLKRRLGAADRDQSLIGHQNDDLKDKQDSITVLQDKVTRLQRELQAQTDQRQKEVRNLESELELARISGHNKAQVEEQLDRLRNRLQSEHAAVKQELEDEMIVLEANLETLQQEKEASAQRVLELETELRQALFAKVHGTPVRQAKELRAKLQSADEERSVFKSTIKDLESRLDEALRSTTQGTPVRERSELRQKLREADAKISRFEERIRLLETDLENAQQEKTLAEERIDLHEMLRQSKIEAEQLQIQLNEKERKLGTSTTREAELRAHISTLESDLDDCRNEVSELQSRLQSASNKEKDLRSQLRELREAKMQLEELEMQLGDRQGSASSHAKKEAELRSQLRDLKVDAESLLLDVEEKDAQLRSAAKKERELRERLRQARLDETLHEDLRGKMTNAEAELQALQVQLYERANKLRMSLKREQKLRTTVESLQHADDSDRTILEKQFTHQLNAAEKKHEAELKGLVRQIQYLRARCAREETFRSDLVYTKKWFLMQVEMYNQCNQADLRLLEDMGITPDMSFHQKRPSLKTVGLAVLATIRMQRLQQAWAGNRKLHESLVKKLEGMKRKKTVTGTR